jgi:hypothetical protein
LLVRVRGSGIGDVRGAAGAMRVVVVVGAGMGADIGGGVIVRVVVVFVVVTEATPPWCEQAP